MSSVDNHGEHVLIRFWVKIMKKVNRIDVVDKPVDNLRRKGCQIALTSAGPCWVSVQNLVSVYLPKSLFGKYKIHTD